MIPANEMAVPLSTVNFAHEIYNLPPIEEQQLGFLKPCPVDQSKPFFKFLSRFIPHAMSTSVSISAGLFSSPVLPQEISLATTITMATPAEKHAIRCIITAQRRLKTSWNLTYASGILLSKITLPALA